MQHLEVSCAVRPTEWPLGVKWLILPRVFGSSWVGTRKPASLTEGLRGFSQYVQENYGMVPEIMLQSLSSCFFPVH